MIFTIPVTTASIRSRCCVSAARMVPGGHARLDTSYPPDCTFCGGIVKTATISFGQAMPEKEMDLARRATLACDLMLVLGSSLVVYPAAGFPLLAKRAGARLAIVNREETDQDSNADLVLHSDIGPTMTAALTALPPA